VLLIDALHAREEFGFHQLLLLHGLELGGARGRRVRRRDFLLLFARFAGGGRSTFLISGLTTLRLTTFFNLVHADSGDTFNLEPKIHLHDILHRRMWLRNEHVKEEHSQESAALFAG
jgi:hypothetical protein